jgi:catechol 2,3-dioxygenase-like lactoylglutathione lyase family enzyme
MKCTQYYPVLMTKDVTKTARFYQDHFRFKAVFEADWYVHLQSIEDEAVNLAILDQDHETIPAIRRGQGTGAMLLNFEVEDVDQIYQERDRRAGTALLGTALQALQALHGVRIARQNEALFQRRADIVDHGKILNNERLTWGACEAKPDADNPVAVVRGTKLAVQCRVFAGELALHDDHIRLVLDHDGAAFLGAGNQRGANGHRVGGNLNALSALRHGQLRLISKGRLLGVAGLARCKCECRKACKNEMPHEIA